MLRYYSNKSSKDLRAVVPGPRLQGVKELEFKHPKPPRTGQDGVGWDRIGQDGIAHNSTCSIQVSEGWLTRDAPQSRCFLRERSICPGNVKSSLREHGASVYLVHSMGKRLTDPTGAVWWTEPHHLDYGAMNLTRLVQSHEVSFGFYVTFLKAVSWLSNSLGKFLEGSLHVGTCTHFYIASA